MGKRVFYLPHKRVVGIEAVTTKVRMVEDAKFKVHKWESNIKELEDENTSNPSKILGQVWDKEDNILEIKISPFSKDTPITRKTILSYHGKVCDPLNKRLREAKTDAWKRWRHEPIHSLMETHRITRNTAKVPDI